MKDASILNVAQPRLVVEPPGFSFRPLSSPARDETQNPATTTSGLGITDRAWAKLGLVAHIWPDHTIGCPIFATAKMTIISTLSWMPPARSWFQTLYCPPKLFFTFSAQKTDVKSQNHLTPY